ncbi:MAG TPA: NAD(P)H-binding protein [Chlamydiales bacterium]|nr:NAD(P)H-binding protein [Chlamydiales bacterium]HPE84588.1 NAD(P)H-binding protein [Chlamydiales bacterium]
MKILLTGATGAVGSELLPRLLNEGHEVVVLSRRPFSHPSKKVTSIQADLINSIALPQDIDIAYYLVHSMEKRQKNYALLEKTAARHFVLALKATQVKQIIYLSGIANDPDRSSHIDSRLCVENVFKASSIPTTVLRAGIIISQKSASFKIILDLVNRLPVMTPPKWIHNLCQPIALCDVIDYLLAVALHPQALGQTFDIGGPDIISYKEMLQRCAQALGKKRLIISVPLLTPYLASLWLKLITDVNFSLCKKLVQNLKNNFICKDTQIQTIFPKSCLNYEEALAKVLIPEGVVHAPVPVP